MSYTDRGLLKLAAKAVGRVGPNWHIDDPWANPIKYWNPLTDDGDALRLAVKLGINIIFSGSRHYVGMERYAMDICCEGGISAVRYGIVRAAAEIGEAMQDDATARKEGP